MDKSERVLIKDLFISGGKVYFYENGGPVLNCKSAEFDHFSSHKKWFKDINGIEWDPMTNYAKQELPDPSAEKSYVPKTQDFLLFKVADYTKNF